MATLEAKLCLRYGTYSQWMNSDIILEQGEAAVAVFKFSNNLSGTDTQPDLTPPAIGLKIGDGVSYFYQLPWVQGIASDVYDWAKQATKPDYSANEISGLADFIASQGEGGGSGGSAASGYRIIYDENTQKYILQYYDEANNEWVNTSSEINLTSILNRISTIERWANGARVNLGNIEVPIAEYVYDEILTYINTIDYNDVSVDHQFVTQVTQTDGKIKVTRSRIDASDITTGILTTAQGGTGLNTVDEDEVLIGSAAGQITTKKFVTEINNNRQAFATVGAIKDYVEEKTSGLSKAMHFIGESVVEITINPQSKVNPNIPNYNFNNAQAGDVILANNGQEFVWTGEYWRLLGDETSYVVKGSITNVDIAEEANINQSKIEGLEEALNAKVDKIEGKSLSTNDYSNEDKEKLDTIYDGDWENTIEHIIVNGNEVTPAADKSVELTIPELTEEQIESINNWQPNPIEHVFINGTEAEPSTYKNTPKSINIEHVLTEGEKDKLDSIQEGAQVNTVESILINGEVLLTPNNNKQIEMTLDDSVLQLNVLEGARYPTGNNSYTDIEITDKKLELSKVATTGNIDDLIQTSNTYIIFNCGSSVNVI